MKIKSSMLRKIFLPAEVKTYFLEESTVYETLVLVTHALENFEKGTIYVLNSDFLPDDLSNIRGCCLVIENKNGRSLEGLSCNYILLSDVLDTLNAFTKLFEIQENQEYQDALKFYNELKECTSIDAIIDEAFRIMQCPMLLADQYGRLLTFAGGEEIDDPAYQAIIQTGSSPEAHIQSSFQDGTNTRIRGTDYPVKVNRAEFFRYPRFLNNIYVQNEMQGYLIVLEGERELTGLDAKYVATICNVLKEVILAGLKEKKGKDLSQLYYLEKFHALLEPSSSQNLKWLNRWIVHQGWEAKQVFRLTLVNPSQKDLEPLEIPRDVFHFQENGFEVWLSGSKDEQEEQNLHEQILTLCRLQNGFAYYSDVFTTLSDFQEQYANAKKTMEIMQHQKKPTKICGYEDVKIYGLLLEMDEECRLRYYEKSLRKLQDYDKAKGTNYYLSLHTYLKCACDKAKTASLLYVHRNTVNYQLKRIEEILNVDLSDGEICLRLYLSFKMDEIQESQQKGSS